MKKLIALILSVLMVLTCLSAALVVSADETADKFAPTNEEKIDLFEGEQGAALGGFGNGELNFSVKGGDLKLCAESSLNEGNGHLEKNAAAVALEKGMSFNSHGDEKVAIAAAVYACVTLTAERNGLSVVNASGDIYSDLLV